MIVGRFRGCDRAAFASAGPACRAGNRPTDRVAGSLRTARKLRPAIATESDPRRSAAWRRSNSIGTGQPGYETSRRYRQARRTRTATKPPNPARSPKGYQTTRDARSSAQPRNPGAELCDDLKANNTIINRLRATIERVIANIKTWRILHTDYRRPRETFEETLDAIRGLIFF
jgi:hypothetical protein